MHRSWLMVTLLTTAFSLYGMNNKGTVSFGTSTESINEQRTYIGTYRFARDQGLVRVDDEQCSDCPTTKIEKVTVVRHNRNEVIVKAILSKATVATTDRSERDNDSKKYNWVWVPWLDDTIIDDMAKYASPERNDTIRGGNRLRLTLRAEGSYRIIVPDDADVEVNLSRGDMEYESSPAQNPSRLHIQGRTVNRWGINGSSTDEGENWDYSVHCCNTINPITSLVTKKGNVTVPD